MPSGTKSAPSTTRPLSARSSANTARTAGAPGPGRRTLAGRLFSSIFLAFLGIGLFITAVLVWDVLRRADEEIGREIRIVKSAFHDPIADQLWAYDEKELGAVLAALVRLSVAQGVIVEDPFSGRRLGAHGITNSDEGSGMLVHAFDVHYVAHGADNARHLGNVSLLVPADLALTRSWPSIMLILTAALVKLLLIWILFSYFAQRQLVRPLSRLSDAVDRIDPSFRPYSDVQAVGAEDGELKHLQDAFNRLLNRLESAHAERAAYEQELIGARAQLEDAVAERTRQLDKARRRAEEASVAKSRFLAMMSHELRTPLNSILGFSQFMVDEIMGRMGNARYLEYAADIQHSARHLLDVINDILDISKVEAGEAKLEEEDLELRDLAAAVQRLMSPRISAKSQVLSVSVPDNMPKLRGDGRVIRQVLMNLFSNANKFTPDGGALSISTGVDYRGGIRIEVADTGIGISADDVPLVLEAFGQVRTSHTVTHEGTGLGLTLSKQLVELHGGDLAIQSEVGKGTTVILRFPADRTIRHI
ncbi:MAG: ATP-binding protein [Rhodospirillales bacterium]